MFSEGFFISRPALSPEKSVHSPLLRNPDAILTHLTKSPETFLARKLPHSFFLMKLLSISGVSPELLSKSDTIGKPLNL